MPTLHAKLVRARLRWLLMAVAVFVAGGAGVALAGTDASAAWHDAQQMVLVTIPRWDSTQGTLRTYERDGAGWRQVGQPHPVVIGHGGAGWGLGLQPAQAGGPHKVEGDGRSPAGVFRLGTAFGYAASANTGLPYRALENSDWCVDVSGSPHYNRLVDAGKAGAAAVAGATEPMRRDLHFHGDQRYREGFVIEHNWQQAPMGGSCIFGHLWKSPTSTTTGCTAMAPQTMTGLLAWLDSRRHPVFVLLPQAQYARLHKAWKLPVVDAHP
jgi:L,D-peptidoglycan transpeptidase YkuD (ErfK/YbiS/YcfS/YnhG family)